MNNQLKGVVQKNTASASQNKFMSKSPNPQNKMMTNTGYGKFKGLQGGGAVNQAGASSANMYARGGTAQGTF